MTQIFEQVITRSYTDVDTTNGINTDQFLEATDGMIAMFGKKKKQQKDYKDISSNHTLLRSLW